MTFVKYTSKLLALSLLVFTFACGDNGDNGGDNPMVTNPKVSVQALSLNEGEDDSKAFVRIRLDKDAESLITVYLSSVDGSAEGGVDYESFSEVPLVFSPGDKNKDFQITILGDEEAEPDESFEITISRVDGDVEIENGTATMTIVNDDSQTVPLIIPQTGYSTPESYTNMNLIWRDEFDGTAVKSDNWTFEIGRGNNGWGNQELQSYQRENATIVDEYLVIEARKEDVGGNYTSSRMITKNKFDFQYGRVDIRAALPKGQGIWPALWMLGANIDQVSWPACGEIDIMEIVGHEPNRLFGTAHWADNGHRSFGQNTTLSSGDFSDEFHVFSIVWDEERIRWYLDDRLYNTLDITAPALNELTKNQFFIFNVAVGGLWPGDPDATTNFPQRMIVDYIRVFQDQ